MKHITFGIYPYKTHLAYAAVAGENINVDVPIRKNTFHCIAAGELYPEFATEWIGQRLAHVSDNLMPIIADLKPEKILTVLNACATSHTLMLAGTIEKALYVSGFTDWDGSDPLTKDTFVKEHVMAEFLMQQNKFSYYDRQAYFFKRMRTVIRFENIEYIKRKPLHMLAACGATMAMVQLVQNNVRQARSL